jgi:hypothetical protein
MPIHTSTCSACMMNSEMTYSPSQCWRMMRIEYDPDRLKVLSHSDNSTGILCFSHPYHTGISYIIVQPIQLILWNHHFIEVPYPDFLFLCGHTRTLSLSEILHRIKKAVATQPNWRENHCSLGKGLCLMFGFEDESSAPFSLSAF